MAKYNRATAVPAPVKAAKAPAGVIKTKKSGARAVTGEGHLGYVRANKSALFLLAAGSLGGEDKFYETGAQSTQRLVDLVRKVAVKDPQWTAAFLNWLRSEGNIRTASVVGAVEAADAMVKAGIPGGRQIVASVLQRADEPGEAMAYWLATRKGPEGQRVNMPASIKRALADAVGRLYNQYNLMKYDSDAAAVRFGDVIDMVHPHPAQDGWKSGLYRHALARRHGRDMSEDRNLPESLTTIRAQVALRVAAQGNPSVLLDSEALKAAGMTWEDALSLAGQLKLDKGKIWKAILPSLGYMALIRNLRNMDEAGVSDTDVAAAIARIQDPDQVARSRQLPYRFYSAYKNAPSLRWGHALDVALNLSLKNIPALGGRTLILIDTSGSMQSKLSEKSQMSYQEAAGLFGIALAMKGEADVYGWADRPFHFPVKGTSVLKNLEAYVRRNGEVGFGTNLTAAIQGSYVPGKYDRMVVISDMQVMGYGGRLIPTDIPCYFFNLAGYKAAAVQTTGRVYELGGLTDHTFKMITMLEAGESGRWPWESSDEELLEKMGRSEEVVQTSLV